MTSIEKQSLIDPNRLNSLAYFESLLAEGERTGILSERDIQRIQSACIGLLAEQLSDLYGERSSSVPEELASEQFESLLYTVSLQLKTAPSPEAALAMLKETDLHLLCTAGLRKCRILLRDVRVLTEALQACRIECPNPFYRSAMDKALPAFLRSYRPDTKAHMHGFFPVYAVLHPQNDLTGVEYVRAYAKSLLLENRFCGLFPKDELAWALSSPRARGENLLHTVLRAAAIHLLAFGTVGLRTAAEDLAFVRSRFPHAGALQPALHDAFASAFGKIPYLEKSIPALARELATQG